MGRTQESEREMEEHVLMISKNKKIYNERLKRFNRYKWS